MNAGEKKAYRSRLAGSVVRLGHSWRGKTNRELLEFLAEEGQLMEFWKAFPAYFDEALFRELALNR